VWFSGMWVLRRGCAGGTWYRDASFSGREARYGSPVRTAGWDGTTQSMQHRLGHRHRGHVQLTPAGRIARVRKLHILVENNSDIPASTWYRDASFSGREARYGSPVRTAGWDGTTQSMQHRGHVQLTPAGRIARVRKLLILVENNSDIPALRVADVEAVEAASGPQLRPGYMYREANWEIGRAAERETSYTRQMSSFLGRLLLALQTLQLSSPLGSLLAQ
jgi:hypothetical protein